MSLVLTSSVKIRPNQHRPGTGIAAINCTFQSSHALQESPVSSCAHRHSFSGGTAFHCLPPSPLPCTPFTPTVSFHSTVSHPPHYHLRYFLPAVSLHSFPPPPLPPLHSFHSHSVISLHCLPPAHPTIQRPPPLNPRSSATSAESAFPVSAKIHTLHRDHQTNPLTSRINSLPPATTTITVHKGPDIEERGHGGSRGVPGGGGANDHG